MKRRSFMLAAMGALFTPVAAVKAIAEEPVTKIVRVNLFGRFLYMRATLKKGVGRYMVGDKHVGKPFEYEAWELTPLDG